jgi:hypothetical protein
MVHEPKAVLYNSDMQITGVSTFDPQLREDHSSSTSISLDPSFGGAFSASGGALTLFGATQQRLLKLIRTPSYSAAIVQMSPDYRKVAEYIPPPIGSSVGMLKVLQLDRDHFLTVRLSSDSDHGLQGGLRLLWISLH